MADIDALPSPWRMAPRPLLTSLIDLPIFSLHSQKAYTIPMLGWSTSPALPRSSVQSGSLDRSSKATTSHLQRCGRNCKAHVLNLVKWIRKGDQSRTESTDSTTNPDSHVCASIALDKPPAHGILGSSTTKSTKLERLPSGLLQLPEELQLELMGHLPLGSLYCLRQTCRDFRRLADDYSFKELHAEFSGPRIEGSRIAPARLHEWWDIRKMIARDSFCGDCAYVAQSGVLAWRMSRLYEPMYCSGCKREHPALFFPLDQRRTKAQGGGLCLGLLGHFSICSHKRLSGRFVGPWVYPGEIVCRSKQHSPLQFADSIHPAETPRILSFPDSLAGNFSTRRTFYMLHLNHTSHISIDSIRQSLGSAGVPGCQELCKHVSLQTPGLLDCLQSDRCTCFPSAGLAAYPSGGFADSLCENHTFTCRHCAATYRWTRKHGKGMYTSYVVLDMTFSAFTCGPVSIGWLANLDYERFSDQASRANKHPALDESSRHILWCTTPGCATGSGIRWLTMAKTFVRETARRGPGSWALENDILEFSRIHAFSLEYELFYNFRRTNPRQVEEYSYIWQG
ncbi:hypothetical protein FZEAL_9078 [Fusarium zealandicum]|uniref:F-box domain-containing protein n=1 Tax=Fusarium zealandicum TaxID=1053134 RepID=A0A8H4XGV7_9HYPO|nr:hypothetical protein FZEAL_9078 [Fusarium zealandicum]